jgi:hypothetical protein
MSGAEWTRLRLADGVKVTVELPLKDTSAALEEALHGRHLLEIKLPDGLLTINPCSVIYIEAAEGPSTKIWR